MSAWGFFSGMAALRRLGLACVGAVLLAGCATGPKVNPADPLEPFNRTMFEFNDVLDRHVLKPVATTYRDLTPSPVQRGVGNFFGNLEDAWSVVNNLLQIKPEGAANSLMRVAVNTVFGFGGLLDIASEMEIPRHTEDFGQTLGRWGVGPGPYVVLPLLGPSTLRDTAARPTDWRGDVAAQQDDMALRNSLVTLRLVDTRARLLRAGDMLEDASFDKYTFLRDAYLQRRRNAVYDGNPPEEAEDTDEPEAQDASEAPEETPAR